MAVWARQTPPIGSRMDDETHITALLAAEDYDAATEAILELYGTRVFRTMIGVLRDETAAEDTFQAFRITLWQSLRRYRGESRVFTWTYTIARRTHSRRLRRSRAPEERLHTDEERALVARWTRTATAEWQKTESQDKLQVLLEDLDHDDRTLVMLRIADQLPWGEIAAILSDRALDADALKTETARLRKRFERVKTRLASALED